MAIYFKLSILGVLLFSLGCRNQVASEVEAVEGEKKLSLRDRINAELKDNGHNTCKAGSSGANLTSETETHTVSPGELVNVITVAFEAKCTSHISLYVKTQNEQYGEACAETFSNCVASNF